MILFWGFLFCNEVSAEPYFFKNCKLSNAVTGNYVINIEKNVIEVELKREDGVVQNFADKIKSIETDKIVSEKIKSGKSDELYYQYFGFVLFSWLQLLTFKNEADRTARP